METTVKFGFKQIFKPTPEGAKLVARGILYAVAIIVFIMQTVTEIPQPIKDAVSRYAVYVVSITHFVCRMFGVDVDQPGVYKMKY